MHRLRLGGKAIVSLGFAPEGDLVVMQRNRNFGYDIRWWNSSTDRVSRTITVPDEAFFSPDYSVLGHFCPYPEAKDKSLILRMGTTLADSVSLPSAMNFDDFRISASNKHVLAAKRDGSVECWDIPAQRVVYDFPLCRVRHATIHPDDKHFLIVENGNVLHTWKWNKPDIRRQITLDGISYADDPCFIDSSRLALICQNVIVLDLETGKAIAKLLHRPRHAITMTVSPDGRLLATACSAGLVHFWDTVNWAEKDTFNWKIGRIDSVAFSRDGLTCAAGGTMGRVVIWDVDA